MRAYLQLFDVTAYLSLPVTINYRSVIKLLSRSTNPVSSMLLSNDAI